jgi:hypothetical protein
MDGSGKEVQCLEGDDFFISKQSLNTFPRQRSDVTAIIAAEPIAVRLMADPRGGMLDEHRCRTASYEGRAALAGTRNTCHDASC